MVSRADYIRFMRWCSCWLTSSTHELGFKVRRIDTLTHRQADKQTHSPDERHIQDTRPTRPCEPTPLNGLSLLLCCAPP